MLQVVGLGPRGAAAVGRLLGGGRLAGAELWVLDAERHQLRGATSILLKPEQGGAPPPSLHASPVAPHLRPQPQNITKSKRTAPLGLGSRRWQTVRVEKILLGTSKSAERNLEKDLVAAWGRRSPPLR